jgi:hypothetical protein
MRAECAYGGGPRIEGHRWFRPLELIPRENKAERRPSDHWSG